MKILMALAWISALAAACSTISRTNSIAQKSASTGDIATISPSSDPTLSAYAGTASAAPLSPPRSAITVNPPNRPVGSGNRSRPSDWQTFSSTQLGIAVNYPGDWVANESAGAVTFRSAAGAEVQLRVVQTSSDNPGVQEQCVTLINAYGLSVNACVDAGSHTYTTAFKVESKDGSSRHLLLSTTGQDALDVYKQMLQSLRPIS